MVPLDIPRPEDVEGIFNQPFVVLYWPAIVGTILFFFALARGHPWLTIPIVLGAAGIQAIHLGVGT